jgi:hypothetical protein
MRNLICLLLILIGTNSFALPSGSQNALQLGGVSNSDNLIIPEANSQGYFTLYNSDTPLTTNRFGVLYKNGVAYQVTAGKTFQAVKICAASGIANSTFQLVSSTASFANNVAGPLTGQVSMSGANNGNSLLTTAANTFICYDSTYSLAASTYAGYSNSSGGSLTFYLIVIGKEI